MRASARCHPVITFTLESLAARRRAHRTIIEMFSLSSGLNFTECRNLKVKTFINLIVVLLLCLKFLSLSLSLSVFELTEKEREGKVTATDRSNE